jgi:hypothetical protein
MPRLKPDEDALLGSSLAAAYLGISRSTLTSWRLRNEIRPTAVEETPHGPRYKFSTRDLDTFREKVAYDD